MKMNNKGFTLIELVIVIVILGILAASAIPKFVDLSKDAEDAAIAAALGAVQSASVITYAENQTGVAWGSIESNILNPNSDFQFTCDDSGGPCVITADCSPSCPASSTTTQLDTAICTGC